MKQILGEYSCKIDSKGRMRLPTALISQLEEGNPLGFVINRGFENCLVLYPEKVWERITQDINNLNPYDRQSREMKRYFYRGAQRVNLDGADRINLPSLLLNWAGIGNQAILSAVNDRVEIWAKEKWESLLDEEPKDFAELAQIVLGNKKDDGE